MKKTCILLLSAVLAAAGCAAKKPHLTADQHFKQASESFRTGALTLAVDEFHELLDQYPFSEYNEEAELKIAHSHYLMGNFAEAIVALTDFQRRHPTSPHLPFVGYCLGMCYARQVRTIDRDQSAAQNAQSYFITVSNQYPDSPFAELAHEELGRCRKNLADHDLYIAQFYATRGNNKAAEIRLLELASRYGDTDTSAVGLLQLAKLYRRNNREDNAALAYQALTQLHPRSAQAASARRALGQLAAADPPAPADSPATADPLDQLFAANGRHRTTGAFETVRVPGLEPARTARTGTGVPGPAIMPPFDPFGRGGRAY
jgi:outer membrane protein assembly factor BamD